MPPPAVSFRSISTKSALLDAISLRAGAVALLGLADHDPIRHA
jgi:hypothetical protein